MADAKDTSRSERGRGRRPRRARAHARPRRSTAARVGAPTRGNRRLEALLDGGQRRRRGARPGGTWPRSSPSGSGCRTTPGSTSRSCSTSPCGCCGCWSRAACEPAMVTDHGMRDRDAEVVVAGGRAAARRRHVDPPRRPRGLQPLPRRAQAARAARRRLQGAAERTVVIAESLHAIIGHRRRGEPYTVEAGVVRVADALDMAQGARGCRSRRARWGSTRSPPRRSTRSRSRPARSAPVRIEIEMNNSAGDLPGRRPAGDQAARHPARGPRRGRRRGRGRDREAAADRVPDRLSRRPVAGQRGARAAQTPAPAAPRPSPAAKRAAPAAPVIDRVARPAAASSARPVGERQPDALDRRAAVGEHRLLREGGEALGDLERPLEVRARGRRPR